NKINELDRKGFISNLINSKRLHIVDLMDGNNYFPKFKIQHSQISLNNTTQVHVFLIFNDSQSFLAKKIPVDNDQKLLFNSVINRMSTALNHLFHSNL
ncbi:unnamed protein product, partial [Adineta steineri]